MPPPESTLSLALVSHTNVGKTTLARTLLGRDVGEVRDAPHVTEFADAYELLRSPEGDHLTLWDTPGFGDSARLVRRLRQADQPLGWFLAQVWDRFADRAFWSSQQALRAVREQADAVLYLVNAAESPQAAGYVGPEMELLAWVGKPVVVLLNQLGAPRPAPEEAAEVERWRAALADRPRVHAVLPLDAFARCWVQEGTLLLAVRQALAAAGCDEAAAAMARLHAAWAAAAQARFDAASGVLAASLARLAAAREAVQDGGRLSETVRRLMRAAGVGRPSDDPATRARQALAARLDAEVRDSTAALVALHALQAPRALGRDALQPAGKSDEVAAAVLARVAAHYDLRLPLDEGKAALVGGVVSGALAGLKADLATGGLTLGGGLLAGGLLGALGAAGAARAVNLVRGTGAGSVGWTDEALHAMAAAALLRYLAVAHYGRGRGDWEAGESPPHWMAVVAEALVPWRAEFEAAFRTARGGSEEAAALAEAALQPLLAQAGRDALARLYPAAPPPPRAP